MPDHGSLYAAVTTRIEIGDLHGILEKEEVHEFPLEDLLPKNVRNFAVPNIIHDYHFVCEIENAGISMPVAIRSSTRCRLSVRYLAYRLNIPIFSVRYEGFCHKSYADRIKTVAKVCDAVNGLPCILYFEGIDRLARFETWNELARLGSTICQEMDNLSSKVIPIITTDHGDTSNTQEAILFAMGILTMARFTRTITGDIGESLEKSVAKKMAKEIFNHLDINTGFWFKRWSKCFDCFYENYGTEMDVIRLCVQEATRHLPNGTGTVGTEGKVVPVPWEEK